MKVGFTTLALFMENNTKIIKLANKHNFQMIEILAEDPFFKKDKLEFKNTKLDVRIHAPTVDINIASLNEGIKKESVRQMIKCGKYCEKINAKTITIHPGIIGRNEPHLRKQAIINSIESIGEIIDNTNVEISLENMPVREKFLANTTEELEEIQNQTNCHLTIDTGHANTTRNLKELLDLKHISYCHINDNDGQHDQHLPLGEGTIDLKNIRKIKNGIIELNNFTNVLKTKQIINSFF